MSSIEYLGSNSFLQKDASTLGSTGTKIPETHLFDAIKWLAENTHGGTNLSLDGRESIASFTLMWSFFESALCENHVKVEALKRVSERLEPELVPPETNQVLEDCLKFWQFRYLTSNGFSDHFEGLNFRNNDNRAHVESVLKGDLNHPREKLLALMIIVFRMRNNLFHGLKSLEMLNDQAENLATASRCIAAILESVPSSFVRFNVSARAGRR